MTLEADLRLGIVTILYDTFSGKLLACGVCPHGLKMDVVAIHLHFRPLWISRVREPTSTMKNNFLSATEICTVPETLPDEKKNDSRSGGTGISTAHT